MNKKKVLKALASARVTEEAASAKAAKSKAAAESSHASHRAAKQDFKAARKAARAARRQWHKARDRAKRDATEVTRMGRLIGKLERKAATAMPNAGKAKTKAPVKKRPKTRKGNGA